MHANASSTLTSSLALVSKYGMSPLPLEVHQLLAFFSLTTRDAPPSTSVLFPSTTKGKLSGSFGDAWMRNSSRQFSRFSNVFAVLTSWTRTQQSAPR